MFGFEPLGFSFTPTVLHLGQMTAILAPSRPKPELDRQKLKEPNRVCEGVNIHIYRENK